MAANDVIFSVSAKDAGFVKTFLDGRAALDKLGAGFDGVKHKSNAAGQNMNQMFKNVGIDVAKAVAGFAGIGSTMAAIGTAVSLIRAEYERFEQTRRSAATNMTDWSKARENAAMNFGSEGIAPHDERIKRLSNIMGVNLAQGYEIAGSTVSTKANLSTDEALQALEVVAKAYGRTGSPEAVKAASRGTLNYMNALAPDQRKDIAGIVGMMISANEVSYQDNPQDFFTYSMQAVQSRLAENRGKNIGRSTQFLIGENAWFNSRIVDAEGRRGRTGQLNLHQDLDATIMSREAAMLGVNQKFRDRWTGMADEERMDWIRSDDPMARRMSAYLIGTLHPDKQLANMALAHGWKGTLTGEQATRSAQIQLLTSREAGEQARQMAGLVAAPGSAAAHSFYDRFANAPLPDDPASQFAQRLRQQQARRNDLDQNYSMANAGLTFGGIDDMLTKTGRGSMDSWRLHRQADFRRATLGQNEQEIEAGIAASIRDDILNSHKKAGTKLSSDELTQVQSLNEYIRELTAALQENTAATHQNSDASATPSGGGWFTPRALPAEALNQN